MQPRAADRKRLIAELEKKRAPLWQDYLAASERAEPSPRGCATAGDYPLLGGGDVNLYSLFVERAQALVAAARHGRRCSRRRGIAADKGAAEFFRRHRDGDRRGWRALFDFENKKVVLP